MPIDNFTSSLAASLIRVPEPERNKHIEAMVKLPDKLKDFVTSERIGAAVRGMMRTKDLAEERAPEVSFAILRVVLGELPINAVAEQLKAKLQIADNLAQQMAREIEQDFLSPVRGELEKYWINKDKEAPAETNPRRVNGSGLGNVVDLRNKPAPPPPPPPTRPQN